MLPNFDLAKVSQRIARVTPTYSIAAQHTIPHRRCLVLERSNRKQNLTLTMSQGTALYKRLVSQGASGLL